eukprot:3256699-Amphidinium_carterae.1
MFAAAIGNVPSVIPCLVVQEQRTQQNKHIHLCYKDCIVEMSGRLLRPSDCKGVVRCACRYRGPSMLARIPICRSIKTTPTMRLINSFA